MIHLVIGGARSGKSSFAEAQALELGGNDVTYIATATAGDSEMQRRIALHRDRRPASWTTLEAQYDVVDALRRVNARVILIDCLTLLVSNRMLDGDDDAGIIAHLDDVLCEIAASPRAAIVVSNEVGLGIVPDNALARRFRDVMGIVHARAAAQADRVTIMFAGLPLNLK